MSKLSRKAINVLTKRMLQLGLQPEDVPEPALQMFLNRGFIMVVLRKKIKRTRRHVIFVVHQQTPVSMMLKVLDEFPA